MIKNILIFTVLIFSLGYSGGEKIRMDGITSFIKANVNTGDYTVQSGDSRCVMSLADGYVKVQIMRDGRLQDTSDVILYVNQGQILPIAFVRKVYSLWNGTDSCQTKIYIGNTEYTGLYIGR